MKQKPVPQTFVDVLNSWGNMAFLASELGQQDGTVRKWRQRNYIPPEYWQGLLKVAKRHRIRHITADRLVRIAATRLGA